MTTLTAVPAFVPGDEEAPISSYLSTPVPEESAGSLVSQDDGASAADLPTAAEETSAQQASHRLGGKGSRRAEPASRRKLLSRVWAIFSGILIPGLICVVALLWQTVRQQEILLTSLDTAFRSGRVDVLPQRVQALEEKQQQYLSLTQAQEWRGEDGKAREALKAQVMQLVRDSEQVRADVTALATQQDALKQLTDTLSSRLDEQVSRIDALSDWKTQREEKAAGTATKPSPKARREPAAASAAVKAPVVSRALTPPFVLTGVERRGGQAYAVVLPAGAGSDWSQLHMLVPGESYRGWTLVSTDGNRAAFQVNGRIQQLTP
ncbi:hypothetical protein D6S17_22390 [Salmonella enterica subsp. enterica serovar Java]|uniref:Uncharacterized protein n=1 Tax=Salmonella enterica subsp. enterica serovar Java TaxID=224729 RepID=A0A5X0ZD86_SALEB|nr:hypothetical protein [Salmonella enterica subsp. enterica serovar Java]EJK8885968.1 hypothetical protein [Salmonella enterica]HAF4745011.1 hypothetical protein [Salmonella enterica]HDI1194838.1 hypothetical protein [Salmonella enterica]